MSDSLNRREAIRLSVAAGLGSFLTEPATSQATETVADANHAVQLPEGYPKGRAYSMPANFGPLFDQDLVGFRLPSNSVYGDVTSIGLVYRTEAEPLRRFLPQPFALTNEPLLRVYYTMNRDVDWMAGGGYNLLGVDVMAEYHGTVDRVAGSYCLVLWENATEPILMGRERGVPKIYGAIEDHRIVNGTWSTCLSHGGNKILDLSASDLKPLTEEGCRAMEQGAQRGNWMGWRYVPGEPGAEPLASYATCFPTGMKVREAWHATGHLEWHRQTWAENPLQAHIVNALAALPIVEPRSCTVWKGSTTLQGSKVRKLV